MSLKKIKMTTLKVDFPPSSGIVHTATSWQISTDIDFDKGAGIIVQSLNDTVNKTSFSANVDIDDNIPLYGRHMLHLTKNGVPTIDNWSRISLFNSNMKGLKINNFMVKTPKVDSSTKEGVTTIKTSDFTMFSGAGDHASTSWKIKSSYGEDRYVRNNDVDNLKNINIEGVVESGKAYAIEARHNNNFNNESFTGRNILLNYTPELELFTLEFPMDFIADRKFWYRVKLYTPNFLSYDVEVREKLTGRVVKSKYNATSLVDYILLDGLTVFNQYDIYGRFKFEDGKVTNYKLVYSSILLANRTVPYRPYVEYLDQLEKYNDIATDGIACVTTRETFDGKILLPSFDGDRIDIYKIYNNRLQRTKLVRLINMFNFTYSLNTDYANIIQMPNNDIVIDYQTYDKLGHKVTAFIRFEYNPIKLTLEPLQYLERPKEKYSTSICASLGVLSDNTLVYVPGFYSETKDADRSDLPLIIVDPTSFAIRDVIQLPFEAKYNVSLVVDKDDNIFVFGGSTTNKYDADNSNVEYWERENNKVYKFDIKTKQFTEVAQIPDEYSTDIYCLQAFLRIDGKIVMFNASHSGPGMLIQNELVFDPEDYSFAILETDMDWDIPFRNNIISNNGCVTRISSKTLDPQKSYTYLSNIKDEDSIVRIEGSDSDITDLVVESGKTVNVEDMYKYDSVTVKGTGLLRWFRPQGILEFTSADLIVTRDKSMTQNEFNAGGWENVLVLEGTNFTIINDAVITPTEFEVTPTEVKVQVNNNVVLNIVTNDPDYTASVDRPDVCSFDKTSKTIRGLKAGSTSVRFSAFKAGSVIIEKVIVVTVTA